MIKQALELFKVMSKKFENLATVLYTIISVLFLAVIQDFGNEQDDSQKLINSATKHLKHWLTGLCDTVTTRYKSSSCEFEEGKSDRSRNQEGL